MATEKTEKAAPKAASKKVAPKASAKKGDGKRIRLVQTGSPISRTDDQRATLIGLGLNKLHRVSELEDTPAVRGMVRKVQHMLKIEEIA